MRIRLAISPALAIFILASASFAAPRQIAPPTITGWNAGALVINAQWTGQPLSDLDPKHGKYYHFYAIDSVASASSYWELDGSGFGTKGRVTFANPATSSTPAITVTINSWTDNRIVMHLIVPFSFTQSSTVVMTITAADGGVATKTVPVIGTIQTRGYGQCTWYVANRRTQQGLPIPPGAYTAPGSITSQYVPQQWDVINFATSHTSIITSSITTQQVANADGSKTVTYFFTIGEMNVKPVWGEQESSIASKFSIKIAKNGTRTVQTGILSDYSHTTAATSYYR